MDSFKQSIITDLTTNINYFDSLPNHFFKAWVVDQNMSGYEERFQLISNMTMTCEEPEIMSAAHVTGRTIHILEITDDHITIKHAFKGADHYSNALHIRMIVNSNNSRYYKPLLSRENILNTQNLKHEKCEFISNFEKNTLSYRDLFGMTPGELITADLKSFSRQRTITHTMTRCSSLLSVMSISDLNSDMNELPIKPITLSDINTLKNYNQETFDTKKKYSITCCANMLRI